VYGDLPLYRPDLLFTEESPICPSSPYSSSKAAADLLVMAYHRTYGLPVTISRCSNNYGSYQYPEKLIPLMVTNALADRPLPVYGQGINVRDWIHVDDHCRAIDAILTQGKVGEIYNVGGQCERTNIDIDGKRFLIYDRDVFRKRFPTERRRKLGIHKRCGETGRRGDLHGVEGAKRL